MVSLHFGKTVSSSPRLKKNNIARFLKNKTKKYLKNKSAAKASLLFLNNCSNAFKRPEGVFGLLYDQSGKITLRIFRRGHFELGLP